MNIVNKLTLRYLKENKRRTLVTIIGVIISVAMITAVATLTVSFLDLMKKQTIADEGEWHVLYKDVNKAQLETIQKDDQTKMVVLSQDVGYAVLEDSKNDYKPYLFLKSYDQKGFEQFPIQLTAGRYPKSADEVVISDHIADNGGVHLSVGDTLTIGVGERYTPEGEAITLNQRQAITLVDEQNLETIQNQTTKTMTIVGTMERPTWEPISAPGYTIITSLDEQSITDNETVHATVILKKVNRSLYKHAEQVAKKIHIDPETVGFNDGLLRYYGVTDRDGMSRTLYSLSAIITTVIMIGSISLIYNAFSISVSERSRQLGMLSSVGATKNQKRNSVFFEGAVIGLISIPMGILSGLVGIGITFYFINSMIKDALGVTEKLSVTVTPLSILIACIVSMITIFISAYIPARRASKVSAIDAIRQTVDIKLKGKTVKTSKLVRKIFGIEAEIGLKNLKRNKRRYITTILSLVVSIVLFLTVAYFTESLKKAAGLTQSGINYDIYISQGSQEEEEWQQLIDSVANMEEVTDFSIVGYTHLISWIDEKEVADELKPYLEKGKYPYSILVHSVDDQTLQSYAKGLRIGMKQLEPSADHIPAIVVDTVLHKGEEKFSEMKAIHTKVGNTIKLSDNWDIEEEMAETTCTAKVDVAALTDIYPVGVSPSAMATLSIIVSEDSFQQLGQKRLTKGLFIVSTDPLKTQQKIEEIKKGSLYYLENVYKQRQEEQQLITLLSVFTYGFIALITAISVANIFNTISTSVSLRKREFGMLKSVGMTPKGFNKMINYESIFYGMKSLLYGIPISIGIMFLIYQSMLYGFEYKFELPWISLLFVVIAIFVIVGSAMLYSGAKVKKENIIDALKQENI